MKAKLLILLIVINQLYKNVAENCICGEPFKRAVTSGRINKRKISIKEHPWQILIEIIFHHRSKARYEYNRKSFFSDSTLYILRYATIFWRSFDFLFTCTNSGKYFQRLICQSWF